MAGIWPCFSLRLVVDVHPERLAIPWTPNSHSPCLRSPSQASVLILDLMNKLLKGWSHVTMQANVGEYELSARYYVRALSLNARSSNVWGYLRTSLSCSGRLDLIPSVDDEDLALLQQQLPL